MCYRCESVKTTNKTSFWHFMFNRKAKIVLWAPFPPFFPFPVSCLSLFCPPKSSVNRTVAYAHREQNCLWLKWNTIAQWSVWYWRQDGVRRVCRQNRFDRELVKFSARCKTTSALHSVAWRLARSLMIEYICYFFVVLCFAEQILKEPIIKIFARHVLHPLTAFIPYLPSSGQNTVEDSKLE